MARPAQADDIDLRALLDSGALGAGTDKVIETHISWVILAGEFAYKIKKSVNLGFLDFSTLQARLHACQEELRLNRRITPELYLGVIPIHGTPGAPTLEPTAGPVIEYAVKMRRFPADALVSDNLHQHPPEAAEIAELASLVARFHLGLPPARPEEPWGTRLHIAAPVEQSLAQLRGLRPEPAARRQLDAVEQFLAGELRQRAALMDARRAGGFVRECHGDLHLGNLVRIGARIVPFDALEFDPALRWIDVLSEVAFLVMDLESHDRRDLAFEFLNRYLDVTGDHAGLPVLPFYLSYRALVRAKVRALSPGAQSADARTTVDRLLDHAAHPLGDVAPILVLMCGISGSGKSWLASRLARTLPAIHLRSDVERKRLFGLDAQARTASSPEQGIYAPDASARTYARLATLARSALDAGLPVIIDATNLRRAHRADFIALARAAARPVTIAHCEADPATIESRVRQRAAFRSDPSEADLDVVARQRNELERPTRGESDLLINIETSRIGDPQELAQALRRLARE
jgi:hypothetical protein